MVPERYLYQPSNCVIKMKKLLSLPPNLVECFYDIEHASHNEWFCTSDPVGAKLGSGGGTAWLLQACKEHEGNAS